MPATLPKMPFNGQVFIDSERVKWVWDTTSSTWTKIGPADTIPLADETTVGLMSASDKAMLDSIPIAGGGFGIVTNPLGADRTLVTGPITFVSDSIDVICNQAAQTISFSVRPEVVASLNRNLVALAGPTGQIGPVGDTGPNGNNNGYPGEQGPTGPPADNQYTFTGVLYREEAILTDTAVVMVDSSAGNGTITVTTAKLNVPDDCTPADRVIATPIFRTVSYPDTVSLNCATNFSTDITTIQGLPTTLFCPMDPITGACTIPGFNASIDTIATGQPNREVVPPAIGSHNAWLGALNDGEVVEPLAAAMLSDFSAADLASYAFTQVPGNLELVFTVPNPAPANCTFWFKAQNRDVLEVELTVTIYATVAGAELATPLYTAPILLLESIFESGTEAPDIIPFYGFYDSLILPSGCTSLRMVISNPTSVLTQPYSGTYARKISQAALVFSGSLGTNVDSCAATRPSLLSDWVLMAPPDDPIGAADIQLIRLFTNSGSAEVSTIALSTFISKLVDYYSAQLCTWQEDWLLQAKTFIETTDAAARTALSSLAQQVAACEFSAPLEFCVGMVAADCSGQQTQQVST